VSGNAVTQRVRAPRTAIYRALLDPQAIEAWRVPEGMRCVVHEFDPHEGGHFRVSLSYAIRRSRARAVDTPTPITAASSG
jgi:uncharacterized protein YndB with AHSA1/START domain